MTTWRTHHKRRRRAIERAASAEVRLDVLVDVLADFAKLVGGVSFLPIFPLVLLRPGRAGGTIPRLDPIVLVDDGPPPYLDWRRLRLSRTEPD